MSEPLAIVAAIEAMLEGDTRLALPAPMLRMGALAGRRVIVTSGPTHEPIDPVRFIANRSSGRQGHAIAAAAAAEGADVVLVSGPVALPDPDGVRVERVETAVEMLAAVEAALPADIFVGAAAVADWRVEDAAAHKLKKGGALPSLVLSANPDILATVAGRGRDRPALVVGFAAETENLLAHARDKLARKGCDLLVLNDVGEGSGTFGGAMNEVSILRRDDPGGEPERWPRMGKAEVAERLVRLLGERLGGP